MANPIYTMTELDNELRQSEIISHFEQHIYDPETNTATSRIIPYVIVMSQDCDLLRDWTDQQDLRPGVLNQVLLYEAEDSEISRLKNNLRGRDLWNPISNNASERYHFLASVSAENDKAAEGLPSMLIDFRRYFTMPSLEILRQVSSGLAKRRCRLEIPYREHLQSRAAFYFQRVGLPSPHPS